MTPCVWCDQPEEGHGTRYAAMVGAHEWTAPQTGTDWPPVPHPLGGITCRMDPSQTAQWWEDTDPDPVPGGGDRLPGHGKTRPLQREPGGVSDQLTAINEFMASDLVRECQAATQSAREAAARTFNIPIEHVVGDGPGLRILSDPADPGRSARIKSILDATRRNT